jgi:DNA-binding response OmpR family regulator
MKILVAEDDPDTRRALCSILEAEGFSVISASDGISALDRFKSHRPQLACLDIMMAGMSGYDVCKAIRALDASVGILFISAKSEELDRVLGLELGADDFIPKPFGIHEVLARVRAVLRRTAFTPPESSLSTRRIEAPLSYAPFHFGPWLVQPPHMRASTENLNPLRIDLSLRELAILILLHRRSGEVVSRDDFFSACWDMDSAPESRTLDQQIARLRKKIEADPANPQLILTVQGVGYRYNL